MAAVNNYNSTLHIPTAWRIQRSLVAKSGATTSSFGKSGQTPGTDAWASLGTQADQMRSSLYQRFDSWNVVSMTGGANDADFAGTLRTFYSNPAVFVPASPAPWNVTGSNPSSDCPNTQTIWDNLTSGSPTKDQIITENLQGIVTVAARSSPWTHVINIGYPYIVNSTNVCYNDSGNWHGSKSVVDKLNTDHTNVTAANVKYVDLTTSGNFGTSPITNNYIQLMRLYGYPHPSGTGQDKIATAAAASASGSGW